MPAETIGLIGLGVVAALSLVTLILYLRSRPIDVIDPTSGDRVLPGILEGDEPPDLPASSYRRFPVGNWPRWPRWPRF